MRASKNDPRPILAITPYICEKVIFRQSDTVNRSVIRNEAGRWAMPTAMARKCYIGVGKLAEGSR